MLKKISILLVLTILVNAENVKNTNIEKFNLNDIKKCSDINKDLLCTDNPEFLLYKNFYSIQNKKIPICNNNPNNMYIMQKITHSIEEPKITTTKNDNKTIIKQTYETKILSNHEIKTCKTNNEIIIKTENK